MGSNTKLSRRAQQRKGDMLESIESSKKLLGQFSEEEITDLVRRDSISVDPTGVSRSGDAMGFRGGGGHSSPVEQAVLARDSGKTLRDPFRKEFAKIERAILLAEQQLTDAVGRLMVLQSGEEKKRKRASSTPCEICTILPAIRSAMCLGCYGDWLDAGRPDRARWKAFKLQSASREGITLVTDQPPPTVTK